MSSYSSHIKATDRLYDEALKDYIEKDKLHSIMKRILDKVEEEWRNKENIFQVNIIDISKPRILFAANERLNTATIILPDESETDFEKKYHIPPVSEYLILTCFDLLGQKSNFISFDQWLTSKKKKNERTEFLNNINTDDFIEKSKKLYQKFQNIYGVKNSFMNFINYTLDKEHRTQLFDTIRVKIYSDYPNNLFDVQYGGDDEKASYLYSLRNKFTHRAEHSTPNPYLWPNHYDEEGWYNRDDIYFKKKNWFYSVNRQYNEKLIKSVKYGIYSRLLEIDKSNT